MKLNLKERGTWQLQGRIMACSSAPHKFFFLSQNHVANFFKKLLTFLVRKLQKTYRCKHFTNFANTFLQLQAFSCTSTGSWISLTKSHWEWHKGRLWEVAALAQKSPGHVLRGQTTSNEESFWKKKEIAPIFKVGAILFAKKYNWKHLLENTGTEIYKQVQTYVSGKNPALAPSSPWKVQTKKHTACLTSSWIWGGKEGYLLLVQTGTFPSPFSHFFRQTQLHSKRNQLLTAS